MVVAVVVVTLLVADVASAIVMRGNAMPRQLIRELPMKMMLAGLQSSRKIRDQNVALKMVEALGEVHIGVRVEFFRVLVAW